MSILVDRSTEIITQGMTGNIGIRVSHRKAKMGEYDPSFYERRNYPAYLEDYGSWITAQIELIRDGQFDELDVENLLEEIEGLSRSNFDAFTSAIRIVLIHMLKWDIQGDYRSRSWSVSIDGHRLRVQESLEESPSYKSRVEEAVSKAYRRARYDAAKETRLPLKTFAEICPFTFDEIMTREHHLRDVPPEGHQPEHNDA